MTIAAPTIKKHVFEYKVLEEFIENQVDVL